MSLRLPKSFEDLQIAKIYSDEDDEEASQRPFVASISTGGGKSKDAFAVVYYCCAYENSPLLKECVLASFLGGPFA